MQSMHLQSAKLPPVIKPLHQDDLLLLPQKLSRRLEVEVSAASGTYDSLDSEGCDLEGSRLSRILTTGGRRRGGGSWGRTAVGVVDRTS